MEAARQQITGGQHDFMKESFYRPRVPLKEPAVPRQPVKEIRSPFSLRERLPMWTESEQLLQGTLLVFRQDLIMADVARYCQLTYVCSAVHRQTCARA